MRIFALGDPHLSFDQKGKSYKPMDIFGDHWEDHSERLAANWRETVWEDDIVLLPGDISWAMDLDDVLPDLDFIHQLPGEKIIIKGNHELWWNTISKVRRVLPSSIRAIQNDHILLDNGVAICGTRGWNCPDGDFNDEHDAKIFARELGRLKLSLESVAAKTKMKIVMLHFPPTNTKGEISPFVQLMMAHHVDICLYGHLHSYAVSQRVLPKEKWGIQFYLVSADYLQFTPKCIYQD